MSRFKAGPPNLIWNGSDIRLPQSEFHQKYWGYPPSVPHDPKFILPGMTKEMSLYAASITLIPEKNNPDIYTVIFNPVAVSNRKPNDFRQVMSFELLNDLHFKGEFNLLSRAEVIECFKSVITNLEKLVKMQEESCIRAGLDKQPLSIVIGETGLSPVNLGVLTKQIFGRAIQRDMDKLDIDHELIARLIESDRIRSHHRAALIYHFCSGMRVVDACVDLIMRSNDKQRTTLEDIWNKLPEFAGENRIAVSDFGNKELLLGKISKVIEGKVKKHGDYFDTVEFLELRFALVWHQVRTNLQKETLKIADEDSAAIDLIEKALVFAVCSEGGSGWPLDFTLLERGTQLNSALTNFFNKSSLVRDYIHHQIRIYQQKCSAKLQSERLESQENEPASGRTARPEYLSRLKSLIENLVIKPGGYSPHKPYTPSVQSENARVQQFNSESLRQDPDFFGILCNVAEAAGARFAQSSDVVEGRAFAFGGDHKFDEAQGIREAFHKGFQDNFQGHFSQWLKAESDPRAPFFIDPVLWMVMDQYQILFGSRFPCDVDDHKSIKDLIMGVINNDQE